MRSSLLNFDSISSFKVTMNGLQRIFKWIFALIFMERAVVETLNEIKDRFNYRGLEWVTRLGRPILFIREKILAISDFYSNDGQAYKGVCNELVAQAYRDILSTHGNLHQDGRIYRVSGGDPIYFGGEDHTFLAITEKPICDKGKTLEQDVKESLLDGKAIIFDPSFQRVVHFEGSGYSAKRIWAPESRTSHKEGAAIFGNHVYGRANQIIGKSGAIIVILEILLSDRSYSVSLRFLSPFDKIADAIPLNNPLLKYLNDGMGGFNIFWEHMKKILANPRLADDLDKNLNQYASVLTLE